MFLYFDLKRIKNDGQERDREIARVAEKVVIVIIVGYPNETGLLSNKYTLMYMVRSLSRGRIVRVDKKWIHAEVIKKDRQFVEAAGLDITPNCGIL